MKVACLCPTAWRPALVSNAIACFMEQDCQAEKRLFILDDSGMAKDIVSDQWELHATEGIFLGGLPAKYNHLFDMAIGWGADYIAVWEDDDIYLPWHLRASIDAMERNNAQWAQPWSVYSLYTGKLAKEDGRMRFHAGVSARANAIRHIDGWPKECWPDFDQQFMHTLRRAYGEAADSADRFNPGYIFRWAGTGMPHAETFVRDQHDQRWYLDAWTANSHKWHNGNVDYKIDAVMDDETILMYRNVNERGS